MDSLVLMITVIVCLLVIATVSFWSKGRFNALDEREEELNIKEKELSNREFELETRENAVDFREKASHEVSAKYAVTTVDYNHKNWKKAAKQRMAFQVGWNVMKALGDPEQLDGADGNVVLAYKFRVKK